jgi:hypothetical protein
VALGKLTLAQLRTAAKQRADMVNSDFVSDAEWNSYINQSAYALYDLLIQKYDNDYFCEDYEFETDGTAYLFDLPEDFYKLLGVDLQLGNTDDSWITLHKFERAERNNYSVPNFQNFYGITNLRYRLRANGLWLTPTPQSGQTIRILYIPRLTELASDSSELDGINGWNEWVIVDAAIKALVKEESDTSALERDKASITARIESAAENRDASQPQRVADVQCDGDPWGTW